MTRYLPADGEDPALWHVLHDDGDEEDLEEEEVAEALAAFEAMPKRRASGRVATHQPYI